MAKQLVLPTFEGMERKHTLQSFVKFEKEGDYVKGVFLGTKTTISKEFKIPQVAWIVEVESSNCKNHSGQQIVLGDKILISEKATMESMRLELEEGVVFALCYEGEKMSKDGKRKFKDFALFM